MGIVTMSKIEIWLGSKLRLPFSFSFFLFTKFGPFLNLEIVFNLRFYLQHFCESRCAHLATFPDLREMDHVLTNLVRHHVVYGMCIPLKLNYVLLYNLHCFTFTINNIDPFKISKKVQFLSIVCPKIQKLFTSHEKTHLLSWTHVCIKY